VSALTESTLYRFMIALGDRLRTIKVENGFLTDLGSTVYWGHPNPIAYQKDCINYWDSATSEFVEVGSGLEHDRIVTVDAYLWNKQDKYGEASLSSEIDILQSINPLKDNGIDETLGQPHGFIIPVSTENEVALEGSSCVKRCLTFSLKYQTATWKV